MKFGAFIRVCRSAKRAAAVARRTLGEFGRDRRGAYSVIVALLLPVITGFVSLGTEVGLWFYDQQAAQGAADASAFSAASYYKTQAPVATGNTATVTQNSENQSFAVASNYGYGGASSCASNAQGGTTCLAPTGCNVNAPGAGATCVAINNPPLAGTQTTNPAAYEVIIAQSPTQLFSKVLLSQPVVIKARSVGQVQTTTTTTSGSSGPCIVALNTANTINAVAVSGAAHLTLNGCTLAVDDPNAQAFTASGGSTVTTGGIVLANSTGKYSSAGGSIVTGTVTGNTVTANPYAATILAATTAGATPTAAQPIPTLATATSGGCAGATTGIGGSTLSPTNAMGAPIYYAHILLQSASTTSLKAGIYYLCPGGYLLLTASTGATTTATTPLPTNETFTVPPPSGKTGPLFPLPAGYGVTIVLLGSGTNPTNCAYVSVAGNGTPSLDLAAPSTGPLAGVLFAASQGCTQSGSAAQFSFSGSAASALYGAVVLPGFVVNFSGASSTGTGGCTQLIANNFNFSGTVNLGSSCSGVGTHGSGSGSTVTTYTAMLAN